MTYQYGGQHLTNMGMFHAFYIGWTLSLSYRFQDIETKLKGTIVPSGA